MFVDFSEKLIFCLLGKTCCLREKQLNMVGYTVVNDVC